MNPTFLKQARKSSYTNTIPANIYIAESVFSSETKLMYEHEKDNLVPYSQHSIFFVTYESAHKARLFHNSKPERLTSDKRSNLLGQFLSYEENEVL